MDVCKVLERNNPCYVQGTTAIVEEGFRTDEVDHRIISNLLSEGKLQERGTTPETWMRNYNSLSGKSEVMTAHDAPVTLYMTTRQKL